MKTTLYTVMVWLLLGTLLVPRLSAEEKPPEKHLLRYRFHKGQQLWWNVHQKVKMTTAIQGNTDLVESTSRSGKLWTLTDLADDGTATFEYRVEYVAMRQSRIVGDRAKIDEYDSRKDEHVPGAFITLEGTVGVPLARITVDPLGKTTKKSLREYRDSENTENRIVVPLPEKPVAVGEHWDEHRQIDIRKPDGLFKKVRFRRRYTLKDVRSDLAVIEYETMISTPLTPQEEYAIMENHSPCFAKGRIELDLDAGHFVRQVITIEKSIVGFQGTNDNVQQETRLTECSCGLKSCDVCNP